MITDGRAGAWVAAWGRLDAADTILKRIDGKADRQFYKLHSALVDEARIYAELATASESVGLMSGGWLSDEVERKEASKKRAADLLQKLKGDTGG